jgi:hypothetical protein
MTGIETVITIKIIGAVKGAAAAAASKGITVQVIQNFASTAQSHGLIAALHQLKDVLAGIGAAAGLVGALQEVIKALQAHDGGNAIKNGVKAVTSAIRA